jgi:hypothetical protein
MVEKLLNVEHIFVTYSFKSKVKIIGEFGWHSWYSWKALREWDFMKVIWKFLELRCKRY